MHHVDNLATNLKTILNQITACTQVCRSGTLFYWIRFLKKKVWPDKNTYSIWKTRPTHIYGMYVAMYLLL